MPRRIAESQPGFGSDSFLDIIANIVGILIILIVMAGVKVARQPVGGPVDDADSERDVAMVSEEPESPVGASLPEATDQRGLNPPPAADAEPIAVPSTDPAPRIIERRDQALATTTQLEAELNELQTRSRLAQSASSKSMRRIRAVSAAIAGESRNLRRIESVVAAARGDMQESRETLENVRNALRELEQTSPKVETIRHLTPVGRVISGDEIYFRVSGRRVSFVPIPELLRMLRGRIDRQKNWLINFPRHQGEVGPVEGFVMIYVIQRQKLSVLDELRFGRGIVRLALSEWKLEPQPDMVAESIDEALSYDSNFQRRLQTVGPDTAITFWVYPDSFSEFRELQTFVHNEGLIVAGRPLPFGMAIAGSPGGTRSTGQ